MVKIKVLILLQLIFISIFLNTFCTEQKCLCMWKKKVLNQKNVAGSVSGH